MKYHLVLIFIMFWSCKSNVEQTQNSPDLQGRKNEKYVWALMTHYSKPNKERIEQLPPPPIGYSFFTVGGIAGEDTVRILLSTVKDLVELSLVVNESTDSASIASLIKGENLLKLNGEAMKKAYIIKPWIPLDSIISKGKQFTLETLFTENGKQKTNFELPQQAYLIDALSNWGMFVFWDDYSARYGVKDSKDLK